MAGLESTNYKVLDQPQVLQNLFHPGRNEPYRRPDNSREDLMIPVEKDVRIGASFHFSGMTSPTILFFHGNGEIVSDYDDFAQFYLELGINFFIADYRGYGDSTGSPTVTNMMKDCHTVLDYVLQFLSEKKITGPLCLMGRSLGSASALELASKRESEFESLIIESGFAYAGPLLRILGIDPNLIGYTEQDGFENIDKMAKVSKPCLVIHAEYDHIIPFSDGEALFEAAGTSDKLFLQIRNANHNDIFLRGMTTYLEHIKKVVFYDVD